MGFLDDFLEGLGEIVAAGIQATPQYKAAERIIEWEEIDTEADTEELEDSIKEYVTDCSTQELEITDGIFLQQMTKRLVEGVTNLDAEGFEKTLLIFRYFQRAWGVRDYLQDR
jgi:hypothetical protein